MFQKILVPLDGSIAAENALNLAVDMARCYGGEVTVLHVQEEALDVGTAAIARATGLATGSSDQATAIMRQQAEAYLREVVHKHIDAGVQILTVVTSGQAAECILRFAKEQSLDLIVMATHGRTGLRRLAFGSVTEDVLHDATCPVVVIRPPEYQD
ncbi:MAG: universal stress protein [Chloroflexi bacterium]|nr:MAG: universal stress protein [Chloroflexota bacterium]